MQRLNSGVHWVHGISMGAARGVLDLAGLTGAAASAAHLALLWVGDVTLYKSLGIAEGSGHRRHLRRADRQNPPTPH